MKKIIRRLPDGRLVLLEYLYACGGGSDFYTARAYESADKIQSLSRCNIDGHIYADLGQLDLTGKALEKSHTDVYRLVDILFPELLNKGLKAEGYIKYSLSDVENSRLLENPL